MAVVIPDRNVALYNLKDVDAISAQLPFKHGIVNVQGHRLLAAPLSLDTSKILQNLGVDAPSPMPWHYDWPGLHDPFYAQRVTSAFLSLNRRAFVLNGMGTGKTLGALWAYDYLRKAGKVRRALITCPLSTLWSTWEDEIMLSFPHLDVEVLHGPRAKRLELLAADADVYLVNHHGLRMLQDELAKRDDIDIFIIDELSVFRNAQAATLWKPANAIANQQQGGGRWVWGLTGTPIPNAPTDAYGQCRLINPGSTPRTFTQFREKTMNQVNQYKWAAKPDAVETVHSLMQPAVRFTLEDCTDLPEQIHTERRVSMSKAQHVAYETMMAKLKAEHEEGQILAVNQGVKASKLMQIACGIAYRDDGQPAVKFDCKDRLDAVTDLIDQSEGKVLIFVPFTEAINVVAEHVAKHLGKTKHYKAQMVTNKIQGRPAINDLVDVVHGGVSGTARRDIFTRFQSGEELQVIVANPATMSHGLTLTAATTIVWYGLPVSNEVYEQANARVRRPGQTRRTIIATVTSSPIETKVAARLKGRQDLQGALLDLF